MNGVKQDLGALISAIDDDLNAWLNESNISGVTKRHQLLNHEADDVIYVVWRTAILKERARASLVTLKENAKKFTANHLDAQRYRYLRGTCEHLGKSDWNTTIDSAIIADKNSYSKG